MASNTWSETLKLSDEITDSIQSFIYLLNFITNIIPIMAVVRFPSLHKKPSYLLILSLSVSNALLGKFITF